MDGLAGLFHQHPMPAYIIMALVVFGLSYSVRFIVESRRANRKK